MSKLVHPPFSVPVIDPQGRFSLVWQDWVNRIQKTQSGGTTPTVHNDLTGRSDADVHPIDSITNLRDTLTSYSQQIVELGNVDLNLQEQINELLNQLQTLQSSFSGVQSQLNQNTIDIATNTSEIASLQEQILQLDDTVVVHNATLTGEGTTTSPLALTAVGTAGTYTKVTTNATGQVISGTSATKADVGLGNVDNTSDLNKPISTATQTALNGKSDTSHTHTTFGALTLTGNVLPSPTRTYSLGSSSNKWFEIYCDNTYANFGTFTTAVTTQDAHVTSIDVQNVFPGGGVDLAGNIGTSTQRFNYGYIKNFTSSNVTVSDGTNSVTITPTTITGITKATVGLGNVDNTSDLNKPISTATQTALNGKQPLDADLTALAALSTTGVVKRTGTTTYTAASLVAADIPAHTNSTGATVGIATAGLFGHVRASGATPLVAGTAAIGTDNGYFAREAHVHPAQTTITGNAGSATILQTARTINGVSFNGSANITITAAPTTHNASHAGGAADAITSLGAVSWTGDQTLTGSNRIVGDNFTFQKYTGGSAFQAWYGSGVSPGDANFTIATQNTGGTLAFNASTAIELSTNNGTTRTLRLQVTPTLFTSNLPTKVTAVRGVLNDSVTIESITPTLALVDTDATAGARRFRISSDSGALFIGSRNDADTGGTDFLKFNVLGATEIVSFVDFMPGTVFTDIGKSANPFRAIWSSESWATTSVAVSERIVMKDWVGSTTGNIYGAIYSPTIAASSANPAFLCKNDGTTNYLNGTVSSNLSVGDTANNAIRSRVTAAQTGVIIYGGLLNGTARERFACNETTVKLSGGTSTTSVVRFECNNTGIGFYGVTPVARAAAPVFINDVPAYSSVTFSSTWNATEATKATNVSQNLATLLSRTNVAIGAINTLRQELIDLGLLV